MSSPCRQSQHPGRSHRPGASKALLVTSVALTALLAACSSSGSSKSTGSDQAATTAATSAAIAQAQAFVNQYEAAPQNIVATQALPEAPPRGDTFGYLVDPTPSNNETAAAVKAAVQAIGWHYLAFDFDPANPATLNAAAESALAKHSTVVGVSSISSSLFSASVDKQYLQAKVSIEVMGTGPGEVLDPPFFGPSTGTAGYATNALAGKVIANWYVANSRGRYGVLLEHVPEYAILAGFTDPFTATVKSLCPKCELKELDLTGAQVDGGQIPSALVTELRANPSIKYLVFDFGAFTSGIYAALQSAGLSYVRVAGEGPETTDLQALGNANKQGGWTGYSTIYYGYNSVDIAIRKVMGLPATTINLQPTQLITSANVGDITEWNKPANALAQFEALWKVPTTPCTLVCNG